MSPRQERPQLLEGVVQAVQSTSTGDLRETVDGWVESLREKLEADPVGTLAKGVSLGAGLVALNSTYIRQGATYLLKLFAWKALSQFDANNPQPKEAM